MWGAVMVIVDVMMESCQAALHGIYCPSSRPA